MSFAFSLPHTLTQAGAVARLKASADEPGWRTGAIHQEYDEPTHTIKTTLVTHIDLPLIGRIKDVQTDLKIVVNEHDVAVSGSTDNPFAEHIVAFAVKHKLAESLKP